jgi:prepilin signal peptidase PulO-like enzyme (type II secretory pathway)
LRVVDTLLVSGATVAGLLIGGAIDPLGQRLADLSRQEDERRASSADESDRPDPLDESDRPDPPEGTVRNLLPSGPAPGRTAAAAVVTAVLFGGAAAHFGRDVLLAPFCVFFAMLVAISVTDLSHRLVPRRLLYAALVLIVPLLVGASALDHRWHDLTGSVVAGAVAFALFFGVWWFIPRGMGFGDVRLAGVIGITVGYLSLLHAYVAFLSGFIVGMLFGVVMMVISSSGRKTRIPFAPSLAIGAVIAVFWGGHIAQSLFHAGS